MSLHIHAPPPTSVLFEPGWCPTCQRRRRFVSTSYEWYSGQTTCLRCGDSWNEDGRVERPFRRGWRKRAVRNAWNAFVRFRKTLASIPPGA